MSTQTKQPPTTDNGKPAKGEPPAAVIKRVFDHEAESRDILYRRGLPAFVTSGALHLVFILLIVMIFRTTEEGAAEPEAQLIETSVEGPAEELEDLTNPDLGFDAELEAAVPVERIEDINVDTIEIPDEPIGAMTELNDLPQQTLAPPGALNLESVQGGFAPSPDGAFLSGTGGMNGLMAAPGMRGRSGATRDALVKAGGGSAASEAAVARGLQWLAKQQFPDGRWRFDGSSSTDDAAATGLALLPFLAAGQTHRSGKYQKTVAAGLRFLRNNQNPATGAFRPLEQRHVMYGQAIAAVALCEAYGMTRDASMRGQAQLAVNFIQAAQGPNGSWGYKPKQDGDTSIVGWQIQALKSGEMAGLTVSDAVKRKASAFLDYVSSDYNGAQYGYRTPGPRKALTAVGLLCRYYNDGWGPKNPTMAAGVDVLKKVLPKPEKRLDMYYYYYATQVVHFFGGDDWFKVWNPRMREVLIKTQETGQGPNYGSWNTSSGIFGGSTGRLGATCLCLLTLEVYYRYLPLYKRDNGGITELER